jgi:hypothetical protein
VKVTNRTTNVPELLDKNRSGLMEKGRCGSDHRTEEKVEPI